MEHEDEGSPGVLEGIFCSRKHMETGREPTICTNTVERL